MSDFLEKLLTLVVWLIPQKDVGRAARENDFDVFKSVTKCSTVRMEHAYAVLLVELALIDLNFDKAEYEYISAVLKRRFSLTDEQIRLLIHQAATMFPHMSSTELFTKYLLENTTKDERQALMQELEDLIAADGDGDGMEFFLRDRFRRLLGLELVLADSCSLLPSEENPLAELITALKSKRAKPLRWNIKQQLTWDLAQESEVREEHAVAVLLVELALRNQSRGKQGLNKREVEHIFAFLQKKFQLTYADVRDLVHAAQKWVENLGSIRIFTESLNRTMPENEREEILQLVDSLVAGEDYEENMGEKIRSRVSQLLGLSMTPA